jgi:uncharacterized phage-like protein YoqJ
MIVAATGHRPEKLGGHSYRLDGKLIGVAVAYLNEVEPERVISGMALGWDTAWAAAAYVLGVPFIAAIPFEGQESRWPVDLQRRYREILAKAAEIVVVSRGGYSSTAMEMRNRWMVDRADRIAALWDGSPGGTGNCVRYARKRKVEIDNLWNRWRFGNLHLDLLV